MRRAAPRGRPRLSALLVLVTCLPLSLPSSTVPQPLEVEEVPLEKLVDALWHETDPGVEASLRAELLSRNPPAISIAELLAAGPTYSAAIDKGVVQERHLLSNGVEHRYVFVIPDTYDPEKPTAVRFMLHGGISTADRDVSSRGPFDNLRQRPYITALPSGWFDSKWWHEAQIENLDAILKRLKRDYNIDENRVVLAGISDGAAGVLYQAMRNPTPWSALLPVVGHPNVLAGTDIEGHLFWQNLRGRPILAINTSGDPLYPADRVESIWKALRATGADVVFRRQEGYGHDTRWWPKQAKTIDRFSATARDPHPKTVTWNSADATTWNRSHWLEVRGLANDRQTKKDISRLGGGRALPPRPPFATLEGTREGNTYSIESDGATALAVLVGYGAVDLSRPVEIWLNGELVKQELVEPDLELLLSRFLLDRDRRQLYIAALEVTVPQRR